MQDSKMTLLLATWKSRSLETTTKKGPNISKLARRPNYPDSHTIISVTVS